MGPQSNGGDVLVDAVREEVASGALAVTLAPSKPRRVRSGEPMSFAGELLIGLLLLGLPLLLFTQLIALWPSALAATAPGATSSSMPTVDWLFGVKRVVLSPDGALMLLVMLVGALASLGESSFRFVASAGSDELMARWTWSYVLRPIQGATLAAIVYFTLRGGLLGTDGTQRLNPYGLAAFAGLVGLFTRQAFQKLKRVFNELWGVEDLDADVEADSNLRLRRKRDGDHAGDAD